MLHAPRHHSPFQPQPNPPHRFSMQPSHSSPSFQAFVPRDPRRETLQSYHAIAPRSNSNTNRQSRHMELPFRRSNEPTNLIQSFPDAPQPGSRPLSVQVDTRRVVTGVLQSALPPSSRPPPINTTPVRSMSIAQLENRHKAALQKLQTYSNQHVVSSAATVRPIPSSATVRPTPSSATVRPTPSSATARPTPSSAKPSAAKPLTSSVAPSPSNLERHHRHKIAMQKLQAHSTPSQPSHAPSKIVAPVTATNKPKPPASVSDVSSKSAKQPEEVLTTPTNSSRSTTNANSSHRRSLFGFSWTLKDSSKSSASVAAPQTFASKSKSDKSSKKQKAFTTPSQAPEEKDGQDDDVKQGEEEEEDEDVPLAQLASRRSSYLAAAPAVAEGYFSRSHSLPGQMHQLSLGPRPMPQRLVTSPMDAGPSRSRRISARPHRESGLQTMREAADENIPAGFQPPPWLDNSTSHAHGTAGPRPLIFEDEAKAIRNSKRLWS
ncbi:hypothetical protein VP01_1050g11 [Puccinia sorghi]|uniref:Uncharacterized protein n=1 Tax=Puccinia sorghi TaxID=27349 RepID=A0A0L6VUE2_9BASI|nr:hypothetical protein VP01_1050g11 [Puccinia sorghi]